MMFPSSFFFLFFMVFGVFFSLSSSNWFLVWCGLEMNLMGFIPILIQFKGLSEIESAMKYFLVQALGSAMVLFGGVYCFFNLFSWTSLLFCLPVIIGLMIKLGVFPFYFWLPGVMMNMSWLSCLLLATWQKIAPLGILISFFYSNSMILVWAGVGSSLIGGIMGMGQSNLKCLLAYSSIGHMGWMVSISQFSVSISLFYLFIYIMMNFILFVLLQKMNFSWLNSMKKVPYFMSYYIVLFGLGFLNLGGIPPLLGFFPKLFSVEVLLSSGIYLGTFGLILGTCFSLYYYISMVLNSCLNVLNWHGNVLKKLDFGFVVLLLLLFNIFGLMILFIFI
uniref:NADH-ubiquinone oxidoreductase chain 2 n=1 Tax=Loxocorone allax TaxID=393181 RepID=B1B1W8_LOXAA|nr:NADH dehydrogenase subunit 2 [Loxocorone allax]BAG12583.1 NADH dehydrogenase subunit 2 [Loxocorone allax]